MVTTSLPKRNIKVGDGLVSCDGVVVKPARDVRVQTTDGVGSTVMAYCNDRMPSVLHNVMLLNTSDDRMAP